ncbi:hypothetical protein GFC01_05995 [Desulfofundulus thermobenzoicus]|uniref:Uncharacterized protein n=1 Tax=Desulfofundulus thermobenzoicus TaxID=29376 RepID=A0A6N7IPI6_9FIRM|nr:hypothetical protein [Desulfofundulus thermobenzoicus]MQL51821.1 hypothetical protein [Desulfofundulus thermobenzoicus]
MPMQMYSPFFTEEEMKKYKFRKGEKLTIYRFLETPDQSVMPPIWPTVIALVLEDGRWVWADVPTHFYTEGTEPAIDEKIGGYPDWRLGRMWPGVFRRIETQNMLEAIRYWVEEGSNGRTNEVAIVYRTVVELGDQAAMDAEAARIMGEDGDQMPELPVPVTGMSLWRYFAQIGIEESLHQIKIWEAAGEVGLELPPPME